MHVMLKYPYVTTVLQHFGDDDKGYKNALNHYDNMLIKLGIDPVKRLDYTAVRGTLGHYILTSQLARQTNQPLPEFEIKKKAIDYYLEPEGFFNQPRWWTPLHNDLNHVVEMVGKLLLEQKIVPVMNGLEFMTINYEHLYAGTCDILAYYKRQLCIVDIKTAWLKKPNQPLLPTRVAKYEAQVSAYKHALIEMSDGAIKLQNMYILSICPDK